jgi:hypothetical protein
MVPDPKRVGDYTLFSELQEQGGEDVAHLFLFTKVKQLLEMRFKVFFDDYFDAYTGVPRGRITELADNSWVVLHGEDFPLNKYKSQILSEFSLEEPEKIGKVKFEFDKHEEMTVSEKRAVEDALKIKYTPEGWIKKKK